ncbi:MAG: deoxyhypusine synthase family protein [Desulfobacterales bacterium]|nr:MAG: deoxyhypusine synthase family protein [Desulfobacterales bacterium]
MPKKFKPIDLNKVQTYPLSERKSYVSSADFAKTWKRGSSYKDFLESLPNILAGNQIKTVITALATAARKQKTIILGMGAHVIKVGLNPVVIDLMQRGIITAVAMNGAGIIHDLEVAMTGQTSEDVAASIDDGSFGMVQETAAFLSEALAKCDLNSEGLGQAVGRAILNSQMPFTDQSILAAGCRRDIPVTVHVAIGTDIIHMHPRFDPAATGEASHRDFRLFASLVATLEGGVYLNVGSAVILPEIFLKAVTLARNLGHTLDDFMTVNLDFIRHYRPLTNVIQRPTARGGIGINLVGHHEILLPLIAAGVIDNLESTS